MPEPDPNAQDVRAVLKVMEKEMGSRYFPLLNDLTFQLQSSDVENTPVKTGLLIGHSKGLPVYCYLSPDGKLNYMRQRRRGSPFPLLNNDVWTIGLLEPFRYIGVPENLKTVNTKHLSVFLKACFVMEGWTRGIPIQWTSDYSSCLVRALKAIIRKAKDTTPIKEEAEETQFDPRGHSRSRTPTPSIETPGSEVLPSSTSPSYGMFGGPLGPARPPKSAPRGTRRSRTNSKTAKTASSSVVREALTQSVPRETSDNTQFDNNSRPDTNPRDTEKPVRKPRGPGLRSWSAMRSRVSEAPDDDDDDSRPDPNPRDTEKPVRKPRGAGLRSWSAMRSRVSEAPDDDDECLSPLQGLVHTDTSASESDVGAGLSDPQDDDSSATLQHRENRTNDGNASAQSHRIGETHNSASVRDREPDIGTTAQAVPSNTHAPQPNNATGNPSQEHDIAVREDLINSYLTEDAKEKEIRSSLRPAEFDVNRINDQLAEMEQQKAALEAGVEQQKAALEAEVEQQKAALEAEVEQQKAALEAELEQQKAALEAELEQQKAALEVEMQKLEGSRVGPKRKLDEGNNVIENHKKRKREIRGRMTGEEGYTLAMRICGRE